MFVSVSECVYVQGVFVVCNEVSTLRAHVSVARSVRDDARDVSSHRRSHLSVCNRAARPQDRFRGPHLHG